MPYIVQRHKSPVIAYQIDQLWKIPHIHSHLELIYLTEGESVAHADNGSFLLEAGSLFLSFPNQIHFYQDRTPVKGYLLIFLPDPFVELKQAFEKQVPVNAVLTAAQLPPDMPQQMEKIFEISRSDMPLKQTAIQGYLMAILAAILPEFTMTETTSNQDAVKSLLSYCIENYKDPLSLDHISQELHLSKYYICHVFKERMGMGFADFISNLRVRDACGLLDQGSKITEAAYASGFSSIRTFNRTFLNIMGMSPSAYKTSKKHQSE